MPDHDILVWGPAAEGEVLLSGKTLDIPGWVWTCSCGQSGVGYPTEAEAEDWAEVHERNASATGGPT